MSKKPFIIGLNLLLACMALGSTGCIGVAGSNLGILSIPIPISPYLQDKKEDQFWIAERYGTVPILGPLTGDGPSVALDPPSDDEVLRAMQRARPIEGGLPLLNETQWNEMRIVKEKIADYVDPPRFIPTIGPAQLHHAHYKCTIYFQETTHVGWPVPHTRRNEDAVEVIYIDHNHFHMVGNTDAGVNTNY
ncbi:MAG: hypothetical protein CMJ64_12095 [Planctomycetaceae bacterium]|nr:hypothetical protein [Planctomycetaceae bacterium]